MKDKITLKGNGSFYIREGWLTKGLVEIAKNPELFSKKNNEGADALGVGSAMSKSIRYWLLTAGLIVKDSKLSPLEYENKKGHFISKTGKYILDNDRYIENKDTLWIIHYNIASNYREATVWNLFFNIVGEERFNRRELESMMEKKFPINPSQMIVRCFCRCISMTEKMKIPRKNYIVLWQNSIFYPKAGIYTQEMR